MVGISSFDNVEQIEQETQTEVTLSESSQRLYGKICNPEFVAKFNNPDVTGDMIFQGLTAMANKHEMALPLLEMQLPLHHYVPKFHIDDSGSMGMGTDVYEPLVKSDGKPDLDHYGNQKYRQLTRYQEAEKSIHEYMEMAAYLPIHRFEFDFLNSRNKIVLSREGKNPAEFLQHAKDMIRGAFAQNQPTNGTPAAEKMEQWLSKDNSHEKSSHYFLFDGAPSPVFGPRTAEQRIEDAVLNRRNPQDAPLAFWSCTNNDKDVEWTKDLEGIAPYTSESDSLEDEVDDVIRNQGDGFPFNKGAWLAARWAAHLPENSRTLDKLDEPVPFTKHTIEENFLGRKISDEEYRHYIERFPVATIKDNSGRTVHTVDWKEHINALSTATSSDAIPAVKNFELLQLETKMKDMTEPRRKAFINALKMEGKEVPSKYAGTSSGRIAPNPLQQRWMGSSSHASSSSTPNTSSLSPFSVSDEKSTATSAATSANSSSYKPGPSDAAGDLAPPPPTYEEATTGEEAPAGKKKKFSFRGMLGIKKN